MYGQECSLIVGTGRPDAQHSHTLGTCPARTRPDGSGWMRPQASYVAFAIGGPETLRRLRSSPHRSRHEWTSRRTRVRLDKRSAPRAGRPCARCPRASFGPLRAGAADPRSGWGCTTGSRRCWSACPGCTPWRYARWSRPGPGVVGAGGAGDGPGAGASPVVLVDRLYDRDVPVLSSGVRLDRIPR